uniref:Retrotransposon gag domain-containing protein n=2 Tax=Pyricularia oryzae TaxID=318829 RepID=L7J7G5_PYRO1
MSSNRTTPQTPSTTNAPVSVDALRQIIATLQAENRQLNERVQEQINRANRNNIKYPLPNPFDGTPGTLQGFLTGTRAYLHFNEDSFENNSDKVAYAASLLKGDALAWFEPTLRDFLDYKEEHNRRAETNRIFDDYDNFKDNLKEVFGNPDKERTAERKLSRLTQIKSASRYASEFRQITSKLAWGKDALMARFYQGLKNEVKDELIKEERPQLLSEYVKLAVKIDNRIYERKLEKKEGRGAWTPRPQAANTGRRRWETP